MILSGWVSIKDIEDSFDAPGALKGCQVLYADYETEDYEGSAQVVYIGPDGELYEATGSHCSCNGLEGQWSPGRVTIESLLMRPELDEEFRKLLIAVKVLGVQAYSVTHVLD